MLRAAKPRVIWICCHPGQECVHIDGKLAEYVTHEGTKLVKDAGKWIPNVGADGLDTGTWETCDEDILIDKAPSGDETYRAGDGKGNFCNRRFCASEFGSNRDNPKSYDETTNTSNPRYTMINRKLVSFSFYDVDQVDLTLMVRCGISTGRNFAFTGRKELIPSCPDPPPSPPPPSPPPPSPPPLSPPPSPRRHP